MRAIARAVYSIRGVRKRFVADGTGLRERLDPTAREVDLAEKAFHDAVARRNDAQIAYLREPSIITHVAFEAAKTAEADALEILNTEVMRVDEGQNRRHS